MKLILPLLFLCCTLQLSVHAQVKTNRIQAFGKVDQADLELKTCDFESDANAMVLFVKGDIYYDQEFNIVMEYHKRIKIFNEHGKDEANVKIDFEGGNKVESITGLQAQTINLTDGKPEITKVDKKQIFLQVIDKDQDQYTFSFANVKPGSVVEYKFTRIIHAYSWLPNWYFQEGIPVRYSELDTSIPDLLDFKTQTHVNQAFVKRVNTSESQTIGTGTNAITFNNEKDERALENIHSLPDEPYMTSDVDNLQSIYFQLIGVKPIGGFSKTFANSWPKVGEAFADDEDFGDQLKRKLTAEEAIITKAKALKTDEQKIAYIFNEVKNTMKWNGIDRWYTNDGTRTAWDKKTGNATEINIILYHLLKQSGVKDVYPMEVSTRSHGKVNPAYPFMRQFNRAVVYIPIDSTNHYVMDASGKYNVYNEIPANLLNSYGLSINKETNTYDLVFLEKKRPSVKSVYINAEINTDGQMSGTASISSLSYGRINAVESYKTDGEKKYIESLTEHDNNLKISSLKMDNLEIDSLPLSQNITFKLDLTGSDGTYIYFVPNMFSALHNNPFLSENRYTNIDFGYRNNVTLTGTYKMPAGYKADALPKSISMIMPDKSISIKRFVAEEGGIVTVRYVVSYAKSFYFKEDYAELHEFYKKMQEMLNEQVVLKKS
ncbi:DUF3857 domain-containing protein [Mucilaginibacter polytrichastri]|uniref:DUF3857 domain-containing protein n=1 Tax=Mucilaginibacter polytrichastri TaxID=1302689 RepID=A0A1Q6A4C3_9SPHI|nr:DUF3857 domain-containing protein [Mucilaginibacter polytrichastri]OKS88864.1 hypothetical protein RG47T_4342 [Mucilaginibacter polytrichastri]SFT06686.1 protein of unknown function [Mucilaginibacter polytrichastri]